MGALTEDEARSLASVILVAKLDLLARQPWREKASCQDADPSLFILDSGTSAGRGKEYCQRCVVREKCYEYARRNKCIGLWGGVIFTVKSTPSGPATAPVEVKPLTRIENGKPVSVVDESVLQLFS